MSDYVEHQCEVECEKCGCIWNEYFEIIFHNRETFLTSDKYEFKCHECDNEFTVAFIASIDIQCHQVSQP